MIGLKELYRFFGKDIEEQNISDVLMFVDVFESDGVPMVFFKDGSVMAMFEIEGIEYEGMNLDDLATHNDTVKRFLEGIDMRADVNSVFIRDRVKIGDLKSLESAPEVGRFLSDKKIEFWKKEMSDIYRNKLYVTVTFWEKFRSTSSFKDMLRQKKIFEIQKNRIKKNVESLKGIVSDIDTFFGEFNPRLLDKKEIFEVLFKVINHDEPPKYREDLSLNCQLAGSKIRFKKDCAILNDSKYISVISVRELPVETAVLMYNECWSGGRLNIVQSFRRIGKKRLEKNLSRNNNINRSNLLERSYNLSFIEEIDEFLEKINVENEAPVRYGVSIYVIADSHQELEKQNRELISILSSYGAKGVIEDDYLPYAYFSSIPGHTIFNKRKYNILSGNGGEFFQKFNLSSGDKDPVDFYVDQDGGVFNFSPFSSREAASHFAVTGSSGAGKSFFVNKTLISTLAVDPYIIAVDNSNAMLSFFQMLKAEKPNETAILRKDNFKFNPFQLDNLSADVSDEQMEFCMGLLSLIIGRDNIDRGDISRLRDSLEQFFKEYRSIVQNKIGLDDGTGPLNILFSIIENKFGEGRISLAIKEWLSGMKGDILNNSEDRVMNRKYMYFCLNDLEDNPEIYEVIAYLVFNKVRSIVRDESILRKQKLLILEEVYKHLKKNEFSEWVDFYFRHGRKHRLTVGLVTQDIEDLVEIDKHGILKDWSKGIVNNLYQLVMFKGNRNIAVPFKKFNMTEDHIEMYKNLGKERLWEFMYWSASGIRRILENIADPYTYFIATDRPEEKLLREKIQRESGLIEALKKCVEITKGKDDPDERAKLCLAYLNEEES